LCDIFAQSKTIFKVSLILIKLFSIFLFYYQDFFLNCFLVQPFSFSSMAKPLGQHFLRALGPLSKAESRETSSCWFNQGDSKEEIKVTLNNSDNDNVVTFEFIFRSLFKALFASLINNGITFLNKLTKTLEIKQRVINVIV